MRRAAASKPDCVAVVCTNFNTTDLIVEMEEELGVIIIDSIAVTFWEACRITNVDIKVEGWGRLLAGTA